MISVQNLRKSFGDKLVLADISFNAEPATALGVVGANGAGKTTLLSILAGMLRPDSGDVSISGTSLYSSSGDQYRELLPNCAFLLQQDLLLYDLLSIDENLELYASLYGVDSQRIDALLSRFKLQQHRSLKINELSGGLARKVSLVRALLSSPKFLVLDEPLAFLDQEGIEIVSEVLGEIKGQGTTVVFSSHEAEFLQSFADNVLSLD